MRNVPYNLSITWSLWKRHNNKKKRLLTIECHLFSTRNKQLYQNAAASLMSKCSHKKYCWTWKYRNGTCTYCARPVVVFLVCPFFKKISLPNNNSTSAKRNENKDKRFPHSSSFMPSCHKIVRKIFMFKAKI